MTSRPFYKRKQELDGLLRRLRSDVWSFGTVQGRRRIGKTALVRRALAILEAKGQGAHPAMLVRLAADSPENLAHGFREASRRRD